MSQGGERIPSGYPGDHVRLPDGTLIGRRPDSKTGGPTIDIKFPDGTTGKIHIEP
jgi:hypothetical protein